MGLGPTERIDGWKSIAAHLGRDRSTVIRWAKERDLPVHALPGGKSRTVYAVRQELDAWMNGQNIGSSQNEAAPIFTNIPANNADPSTVIDRAALTPILMDTRCQSEPNHDNTLVERSSSRWRLAAVGIALLVLTVIVLAKSYTSEHTLADLTSLEEIELLQARDDLATRSESHLDLARATLESMAKRHPNNAEIQEALADAWILAREYGSQPDGLAFDRAGAAAAAARRINPASVVADRVEGVIAYWWDRNPVRAGIAFRRALAHAPADPLAHLWYANILADNGEDRAAAREFSAARTLMPGTPYLLADYAWALWSAGQDADAIARLKLLSSHTDLASVPDCLSVIALAAGDLTGYARYLRARAALRQRPELTAYSRAVDNALARGGKAGLESAYAVMLSRAISLSENADHPDHSWPAFVAHAAGDHAQLLAILHEAQTRGEHWGAAGFVRRMRARWAHDPKIIRGLDTVAQPRIEGADMND